MRGDQLASSVLNYMLWQERECDWHVDGRQCAVLGQHQLMVSTIEGHGVQHVASICDQHIRAYQRHNGWDRELIGFTNLVLEYNNDTHTVDASEMRAYQKETL